jgi:adenine phosphoribosyltransferase|tara:strand:- start:1 stop:510 length:510 start_codon:yes stop_codon:yes gene_type:complete
MELKNYVRSIPDFPKEGILYRDITPLLKDTSAFKFVVNKLSELIPEDTDSIVAPESRGFIFASAVCFNLDKELILARKKGKLPYKTFEVEYELEYGSDCFQMHIDSLKPGKKVAIIDDLLATGGTISALENLIKNFDCEINSACFVIELMNLNGRSNIECENIHSLIDY